MRMRASAYTVFTLALWSLVLPAILVADAGGAVPWRSWPVVAGAALMFVLGALLIDRGARTLAAGDVGLFGVRPGERLVTSGIYGRIRNPIDVGSVLTAGSVWIALDLALAWVIPAGAIASAVAGVGPYEDRLLLEEFGDEFSAYRRAVPKWLPRIR